MLPRVRAPSPGRNSSSCSRPLLDHGSREKPTPHRKAIPASQRSELAMRFRKADAPDRPRTHVPARDRRPPRRPQQAGRHWRPHDDGARRGRRCRDHGRLGRLLRRAARRHPRPARRERHDHRAAARPHPRRRPPLRSRHLPPRGHPRPHDRPRHPQPRSARRDRRRTAPLGLGRTFKPAPERGVCRTDRCRGSQRAGTNDRDRPGRRSRVAVLRGAASDARRRGSSRARGR
jgi:hypothetical protein